MVTLGLVLHQHQARVIGNLDVVECFDHRECAHWNPIDYLLVQLLSPCLLMKEVVVVTRVDAQRVYCRSP
jgi:hypothetical protein